MELLAPHLPAVRSRQISDGHDALSPTNFLPSSNSKLDLDAMEKNQLPQSPYFLIRSAKTGTSRHAKALKRNRVGGAALQKTKNIIFASDGEYSSDTKDVVNSQSQQPMKDTGVKQSYDNSLTTSEDDSFNRTHG